MAGPGVVGSGKTWSSWRVSGGGWGWKRSATVAGLARTFTKKELII